MNRDEIERRITCDTLPPHSMQNLHEALDRHGITLAELARRISARTDGKWSTATYKIASGLVRPRREWLQHAAFIMGEDPADLVGPLPVPECRITAGVSR